MLDSLTTARTDDYPNSLATCVSYDDDAVYPSKTSCAHYDHNFCTASGEDANSTAFNGTILATLCADACGRGVGLPYLAALSPAEHTAAHPT